MWGGQSWAAAAFLDGSGRLKAGCGQNCPPHKVQVARHCIVRASIIPPLISDPLICTMRTRLQLVQDGGLLRLVELQVAAAERFQFLLA